MQDSLAVSGVHESQDETAQVPQEGHILDHELHQRQHDPRIVSFGDGHESKDLLARVWREFRVETVHRDEEEENARNSKRAGVDQHVEDVKRKYGEVRKHFGDDEVDDVGCKASNQDVCGELGRAPFAFEEATVEDPDAHVEEDVEEGEVGVGRDEECEEGVGPILETKS